MSTAMTIFEMAVPEYAQAAGSKDMQAMGGGLTGGYGNSLSIRNSKFRLVQSGSMMDPLPDPYLDVVIFALSPDVQRVYYKGAYEAGSKELPSCYSHDGKTPATDARDPQSSACATCPQNIKGSGKTATSKACSYKKRVLLLSPDDLAGPMYAFDVNAMSMFGEQIESLHKYSFKGYFEKLKLHNMRVSALVTRLSFNDAETVPVLHFSPVRQLTAEEFAIVQDRMEEEEVAKLLSQHIEAAATEGETAAARKPAPKPVLTAPAPAAPKAAPAKGFNAKRTPAPAAAAAQPAAAPPAAAAKSVVLDLESMVDFDD